MIRSNRFAALVAVLALLPAAARSHIEKNSLNLKANDSFAAGSKVDIKWTQQFGHNDGKYQLRYSKDGGTTWTDIEAVWQGPKGDGVEVTYSWTVPAGATTQAKVHVSMSRGGLTDPDYNLISPNFTVTGGSSVGPVAAQEAGSLRFDARTRNLEVSFALAAGGEVLVQAFDAGGRLVATLLEGRRPAGSHRVSVFSNRLDADAPLIFRLTAGGKTLAQAAPGVSP